METELSFGSWVRRRRKALDLLQKDLADQVGCSVSALQKIERDERPQIAAARLSAIDARVRETTLDKLVEELLVGL